MGPGFVSADTGGPPSIFLMGPARPRTTSSACADARRVAMGIIILPLEARPTAMPNRAPAPEAWPAGKANATLRCGFVPRSPVRRPWPRFIYFHANCTIIPGCQDGPTVCGAMQRIINSRCQLVLARRTDLQRTAFR